jgi:hypothetical protein
MHESNVETGRLRLRATQKTKRLCGALVLLILEGFDVGLERRFANRFRAQLAQKRRRLWPAIGFEARTAAVTSRPGPTIAPRAVVE